MTEFFRLEKVDEHRGIERFAIVWISDELLASTDVIQHVRLGGPLTTEELRGDLRPVGFSDATIDAALNKARDAFLHDKPKNEP